MNNIESMQFNIFYSEIKDMRGKSNFIEKHFEIYFPEPFNILPVPDNAPAEIPRMIGVSTNQHSTLQISANTTQLHVNIDGDYCKDMKKCFEYMRDRMEAIKEIIKKLNVNILFAGLIIQIRNDKAKPVDFINDKFFKLNTKEKLFDIAGKATFIKEEKYYINLAMMNLRDMHKNEYLGINLDINDRYRHNFNISEYSDNDVISKILEFHIDILENKIDKFIEEGEF